jgi:hypothetical protein
MKMKIEDKDEIPRPVTPGRGRKGRLINGLKAYLNAGEYRQTIKKEGIHGDATVMQPHSFG